MSSNRFSLALAVLLAFFASACGKQYSADPGAKAKEKKVSLLGLSVQETLRTKYDSLITFCELTSPAKFQPPAEVQPRTFRWDIVNDFAGEKSGRIALSTPSTVIDLRIDFSEPRVVSHREYRDLQGQDYHLKNSPEVGVQLRWKVSQANGQGTTHQSASLDHLLIEGMPATQVEITTSGLDGETKLQISCVLATQAKPAYLDEFSRRNVAE